MAATSSAPAATSSISFFGALNGGNGKGAQTAGQSIQNLFASLATASVIAGVQLGFFLMFRNRLSRVYVPRTYLVPERERTNPPPKGLWQWLIPVIKTNRNDFIQKSGLDAYFFLRYLRMLLKIFIPAAFFIILILVPLNSINGRGSGFAVGIYSNSSTYNNVTGLDQLSWGNVRPTQNNRYWAHLILAVLLVVYVCFTFWDELRGYIRLRQAYLTSPQHRIKASATTVLVTGIPKKWLTFEALDGLYDVFPGGVRNIWINRNFDGLSDKVKRRDAVAVKLENAYTALIRNAKIAYLKRIKKTGEPNKIILHYNAVAEATAKANAKQSDGAIHKDGVCSGDPRQVHHTLDEALAEASNPVSREHSLDRDRLKLPIHPPLTPEPRSEKDPEQQNTAQSRTGDCRTRAQLDGADSSMSDASGKLCAEPAAPPKSYCSATTNDASSKPSRDHVKSEPSIETKARETDRRQIKSEDLQNPERLGEAKGSTRSLFKLWKSQKSDPHGIPSPTPHGREEDEFPLSSPSPITPGDNPQATINGVASYDERDANQATTSKLRVQFALQAHPKDMYARPPWEEDEDDGEPTWREYLKDKDRETMRLPALGFAWWPTLPFIGTKVDTIDYCRGELAKLNVEIEIEQMEAEKFPLMNSAFIQFNNQVAAHMACQAVSHHSPFQMTPRLVEISPDDVIWDNMSLKWWESYLRTIIVVLAIIGLVIGWAIPVTFTGLLSQVHYLATTFSWLAWLLKTPPTILAIIQGVLPQIILGLLLFLLPVILRILVRFQGSRTGMSIELAMQSYYFFFLFVQVFLVVSISSGITTVIQQITKTPQSIPSVLAQNLPKASNYFFSYLLLQGLSTSAGALVQIWTLIQCFVFAKLFDKTARQKWTRQTSLPLIGWGTFFPVFTNLAAIGLIYSVISPIILLFCIAAFGLFWIAYRYNTLYVTKFRFDTGGLLFPKAINQLFTGLYFMELCLIGLFFLVRDVDPKGNAVGTPCKGQAIVMIVVLIGTAGFQWLMNDAFDPLVRYLPITLEDEAVERDEMFALTQEKRWEHIYAERDREDKDLKKNSTKHERHHAEDGEDKEIEAHLEQERLEKNRQRFEDDYQRRNELGEKLVRFSNAYGRLVFRKAKASWISSEQDFGAEDLSKHEQSSETSAYGIKNFEEWEPRARKYDGVNDPGETQNTSETDLYGVSNSEDRRRCKRRREYYKHLEELQHQAVEEHWQYVEARKEMRQMDTRGLGYDGNESLGEDQHSSQDAEGSITVKGPGSDNHDDLGERQQSSEETQESVIHRVLDHGSDGSSTERQQNSSEEQSALGAAYQSESADRGESGIDELTARRRLAEDIFKEFLGAYQAQKEQELGSTAARNLIEEGDEVTADDWQWCEDTFIKADTIDSLFLEDKHGNPRPYADALLHISTVWVPPFRHLGPQGSGPRPLSAAMGHTPKPALKISPKKAGWAERSRKDWAARSPHFRHVYHVPERKHTRPPTDLESQSSENLGRALFSEVKNDLEDLTIEERDRLVRRAFQHEALRSKRPVIWIPRDELGVSDDEIYRCQRFSKHVWISNEFAGLDGKGGVVYARPPPDFDEIDLFEL